jgi:chemotaxis protein MotB
MGDPDDEDAPTVVRTRSSPVAWVLLLATLGGGGYGGYWLYGQLRDARAQRGVAEQALSGCRATLATSQQHAQSLDVMLATVRGDLSAAQSACDSQRGQLTTELASYRARAEEADALEARLRAAVGANGELHAEGDGRVTLQLVDRVLFPLGEADLTPSGMAVLDRVAETLQAFPDKQIQVQGHTDDTPIRHTERFASNWELSTARALSVVHYLQDHAHVDPRRLAAVGFGPYHPLSARHDARNRRIEIVLAPRATPQTVRR